MNRASSGFTLVELLITVIVMIILLTLGVVSFSQAQRQARDADRAGDVEVIARGLEEYYRLGNPEASSTPGNMSKGTYPGLNVIIHMQGYNMCGTNLEPGVKTCNTSGNPYILKALPGVTQNSLKEPSGGTGFKPSWLMNTSQETAAITQGAYLYDAFDRNGDKCYGDPTSNPCVRFTIRYREEVSGNTITVKSKRQQ